MKDLMNLYSSEMLDEFMEDPRCGNCGKEAMKRCSRCKNQWYCSQDCQIKAWKAHKPICELISRNMTEEEKQREELKEKKKADEKKRLEEKKTPLIQEINKLD